MYLECKVFISIYNYNTLCILNKKIYMFNEDHEYDINLIHRRIYIYGYIIFLFKVRIYAIIYLIYYVNLHL